MIVDQLPFDQQTLAEALRTQQKLRRISIPAELGEPSPGWADAYDKQLAKTPSAPTRRSPATRPPCQPSGPRSVRLCRTRTAPWKSAEPQQLGLGISTRATRRASTRALALVTRAQQDSPAHPPRSTPSGIALCTVPWGE